MVKLNPMYYNSDIKLFEYKVVHISRVRNCFALVENTECIVEVCEYDKNSDISHRD